MYELPHDVEQSLEGDLRSFFWHSGVGMVQLDAPNGIVLQANPAFERMIGVEARTHAGRPLEELPWTTGREPFISGVGALLEGANDLYVGEVELDHPDGGPRSLSVDATAVGMNEKRRVFVLFHDVTEKSEQVEEGKALRDHLTDQLEVARRERVSSQHALENEKKQKDEFLATLSHELRNPLAPIRNATRIARTPTTSPEQLQWSLGVIERQVQHLARVVEDLLDISRITRGRLELRIEQTRLDEAIRAAVEVSRPLLDSRQHRLEVEMPEGPLWVEGDAIRLAQIFGNLVTNSAKYTQRSGEISICVARERNSYVTVIKDNGEGIDPELLPNVFTMFAQSDAHGRREGGLGIGLALVDGLVKLHKGSVEVQSEGVGRGSEFTVRLPISQQTQARRNGDMEADRTSETSGVQQLRILVADDNIDAAESLTMLLRLQGHEVRVAHDGMGAIKEAGAFRPQVALVDIGMPIMNGHDVARWIRAQSWGGSVRVIALTGWNQPIDRVQTSLSGFDRHLAKPVSIQELTACFAEVKQQDRAERV